MLYEKVWESFTSDQSLCSTGKTIICMKILTKFKDFIAFINKEGEQKGVGWLSTLFAAQQRSMKELEQPSQTPFSFKIHGCWNEESKEGATVYLPTSQQRPQTQRPCPPPAEGPCAAVDGAEAAQGPRRGSSVCPGAAADPATPALNPTHGLAGESRSITSE